MKAVVFTLAVVVVALSFLTARSLIEAGKTHDAVCAYRNNLQQEADRLQKLLDDNPGKEVIDIDIDPKKELLVSRAALVSGVSVRLKSVAVFDRSGLVCD